MLRRTAIWSVVFGTTLSAVGSAAAQDVGSMLEVLDENVVSGASLSAERASETPAMSSTITAEQLRRYGIRNVADALNYLSLGMFAHDRMSTAEVGARGVALPRDLNSHVLVVLDGMVMNEQSGGAVFLHDIPIEVVDHIEVILGPGSVLYGSQAMLGVINVVTKEPKDRLGYHANSTFGVSPPLGPDGDIRSPSSAGSLGHDNRYSLGFGKTFRLFGVPSGVVGSFDYSDFKGPRFVFDRQTLPTRLDGSAGFDLGPNAQPGTWGGPVKEQWFHRTAGGYVRLDIGDLSWTTRATVTRLAMPQMDLFESRAPAAYDDPHNTNEYELFLSSARIQRRLSEKISGMGRAYFGYSARRNQRLVLGHDRVVPGVPLGVVDPEQCPPGPTGPCNKEGRFYSRWVGLEVQSTYDWLGDGAVSTMAGIDGRLRTSAYEYVTFDVLSGLSYGSDPALTRWHGGGHDEANEYSLGAYLQQTVRPWKVLTLNAGIRADADSRMDSKYIADALSPRVAGIATPTDNLSFKLIYSTAYRSPSFLEQHIVNGRLLPNPDGLQPETVASYEASTTLRVNAYTVTLGGFYANWHDLIELQILKANAPSVSRFDNVADVRNYGGSLAAEGSYLHGKLRAGLNLMVTAADRVLSDEQTARNERFGVGDTVPLAVAPKVYGNARGSYAVAGDTEIAVAAGYFGTRIADQAYYAGEPSNLVPRPEAPPKLELRTVLTGSFLPEVGYALGANYSFATYEPYVVGPNQGLPRHLLLTPTEAELARVNRLTVFAGLEFHLDGVENEPAHPEAKP